ncbi:neprilysin-4-like [Rhipicephalus sanguineus]|uniref:neprilysin-4-like n=1 Tax=Rhipicephalus sanguineus TaxID=34632 RepID=UPI0020C50A81|nr:neprilysin-4-like [Rhipicephalus sanguineus]
MARSVWSSLIFFTFMRVAISDYSFEERHSQESTRDYDVCRTKVCREKANEIKKTLSETVRPCDDFYKYVCSGWEQANEIPSDRVTYGAFKQVEEKLFKDLRENPDRRSLNDLKAILAEDGFEEWPLVSKKKKQFGDYKAVLLKTGMTPLFRMSVTRDTKDLSRNIIQFDQIGFSLIGRNELMKPKKKKYKRSVHAYKALIRTALSVMNPKLKPATVSDLSEEIFSFESQLAKMTASKEERRDVLRLYKRATLRELERKFRGLPLLDLLNLEFTLVNITLTEKEPVGIMAERYFALATKFLKTASTRALFNYMGWRAVLLRASHASKRFREAKLDFNKASTGLMKEPPLWKTCVKLISSAMKEVVGRVYVMKKFSARAKEDVEKLVENMKRTFQERLRRIKLMDKSTKQKAEQKLKNMTPKIGYPEWMLDTDFLEHLYRHLGDFGRREPFVRMLEKVIENNYKNSLLDLRQPFNKTLKWSSGPAVVNAFYSPDKNEMLFPSAILKGVFYRHGLPDSLNLGGIGSVIGHEMTHGYDDRGSQFDGDGRLQQWWSKRTRKHFMDKANCFVKQYGDIFDAEAGMQTLAGDADQKPTRGEATTPQALQARVRAALESSALRPAPAIPEGDGKRSYLLVAGSLVLVFMTAIAAGSALRRRWRKRRRSSPGARRFAEVP